MYKRRHIGLGIVILGMLLATGTARRTAVAAQTPDQNPAQTPDQNSAQQKKREKNIAAGAAECKQLLLLMDKDKNGKVSRQEFMSFMEAEFDRLDKNNDGQLDVQELTQAKLRIGGAIHR